MKRIGTIDLLKFVLAVVIVLHHYQQVTGVRFSGWNFYGGTIYFGYAVEFFFIISGFFSVSGILAHPDERFKSYFMRKAVRLYPMTVLSVLATAGLMVIYRTVRGGWFLDIAPGLWRMLNSMLLTHTGGGISDLGLAVNNPTWYLCVLLICYVLLWQIVWVCRRMKVNPFYWFAAASAAGVGIVKYGIRLPFVNYYTGRGYAAFFLGALLWYAWQTAARGRLLAASVFTLILCGAAGFTGGEELFDDQWGILTFIIFPCVLLSALCLKDCAAGKWCNALGGISFEMYLWHFPMLILWDFVKDRVCMEERIWMAVFTVLVFILSAILYVAAEIPLTRRLDRLRDKDA